MQNAVSRTNGVCDKHRRYCLSRSGPDYTSMLRGNDRFTLLRIEMLRLSQVRRTSNPNAALYPLDITIRTPNRFAARHMPMI